MTHLAQTFPVAFLCVAAFTDLNETVTVEQEEINTDQTTHNPPGIGRGEPTTQSVSITIDNRNSFLYKRAVGDVHDLYN